MRRLILSCLVIALTCLAPGIPHTISQYRSAATRTTSVVTPPLFAVGVATPQSADHDPFTIHGLTPGTSVDYLLNIQSDGSSTRAIATAATTSSSTALDTDATNGLQVQVDRCSTLWQQASAGAASVCNATTTSVLASTSLASANAASPTLTTSGLSALSPGGIDHLRIRFSLPSSAPAGYSSLTSTPTVTVWGQGLPGAPTGVTGTAGDGQVAVSWTAPSTTGNASISGYTVSASPSGQTCSTSGTTSCTITGLTDGATQSITVTASNTYGTGPASSAVSATPYPANLFTAGNGFSLWLDGADPSTLFSGSGCTGAVSQGGTVGCWKDKSPVSENFTQTTAANQPVLGTLNGLGATDFTSVSQILNSTDSNDTYQTVFIAAQLQANSTGYDYVFGTTGTGEGVHIRTVTGGGGFPSPNGADWAYNTGTPPLDWSNGAQGVAPAYGSTVILAAQSTPAQSAAESISGTFSGRGMLGYVGEVIAFSGTLTTTQRQSVEDYLARKWGTTLTPDPPGTPTATAGTASASVSWTAPAFNGGSAVTGYTVTASSGQTCTTTGATSCTVTGLTNGTSDTFTVTATNSVGTSAASAASAAVTPLSAPGAPTGLSATATTTSLAVSWSAPASNGGAAISSYTATASPGGATCTSTTTSCTITGLSSNTTYSVTVTATNSVGAGPASSPLSATTATPPGAPTGVTGTAGDGQVAVSWTAPSSSGTSSISGYKVTASPSGQMCTTTGATSCTITGLSDGSTQSITVTASNSYGTGPASSAVNATPYPANLFTSANGLSLWLDGADQSTLFSSSSCTGTVSQGGSVGCWKDKSPIGENFTQATSGSQPLLGTLNGLSAIDFTSVSQVLNSINSTDRYQTVFLALLPKSNPAQLEYFFGQAGADFSIRQSFSGATPFATPNGNDWAYNTGSPPLDWTNGQQTAGPALNATSVIADQAASPQTFAASVSSTFDSRGIVGDVGEVVAFSGTLTTAQRQTVEDYLARKWGTTLTPDPPGTPAATAGTASASVSWTAPASNGGSAVTGYTATSSRGQTCTTTGATNCTVTGLTSGTSYTFTVTATNSIGTSAASAASAAVSAH